jgi:hypothetical protein
MSAIDPEALRVHIVTDKAILAIGPGAEHAN